MFNNEDLYTLQLQSQCNLNHTYTLNNENSNMKLQNDLINDEVMNKLISIMILRSYSLARCLL